MNNIDITPSISVVTAAQSDQSQSLGKFSMSSLAATPNPDINKLKHLTPQAYAYVSTLSVTVDGEPASLIRYERSDGRGAGVGGEHFSLVVSNAGVLKGLSRMEAGMGNGPLASAEDARASALAFLRQEAPDLLKRMEISWIKPHEEVIQTTQEGRPVTLTLTGMKVKARNLADGRWFWVIVGANNSVMVFERDIVWVTFPGHRKTEKWLHDAWLMEKLRKLR